MDYKSWSHHEAVQLPNGLVTRRTGLQHLKSPKEITAYYLDHFGPYWFNELPKTDNTYSPSSKYYGCTLAPGIPLVPNLCRRPLHSPGTSSYLYPYSEDVVDVNRRNSWWETTIAKNESKLNGTNNHDASRYLADSTIESDSDYGDGDYYRKSQNKVFWFSWIITTVTTVITVITETLFGSESKTPISASAYSGQQNNVAWYQYPILWLYKSALLVQRLEVWLLTKIHSVLNLNSWGTSQQRRRWTLCILLIPLIVWAGLFIADCSFLSSETFTNIFNTSRWESSVFSFIEAVI